MSARRDEEMLWTLQVFASQPPITGGGGNFTAGVFRRRIFCVSNSCIISHDIFRPLCEINPLRNLAKCFVQQLPEHKSVVPFHNS